jgi:hypothetical protein
MSRAAYWVIGGIVGVLMVAGLIAFSEGKENEDAQQKAIELSALLERAGATAPDQDIIARALGDDGGAVCDNADDGLDGLNKAILFDQLVNGGSHVGRRPIIADDRLVLGQLAIVATYCPEYLEDFGEELEDLKYDDTIRD